MSDVPATRSTGPAQAPEGPEGSERAAIARVGADGLPRTRTSLVHDLRALGLAPGSTVLVHASLSSLGWVAGREVAVVQALLDVLGPTGTLVVPTQTGDNSDPGRWSRPPVPDAWWPVIRAETPAYDPAVTPSRGMGLLAERVRTWPGALRSSHPQHSFAAVGARAAEVTDAGTVELSLGEASPLGVLDRLGAQVLFLGTGWGTCTALHLAEYRAAARTGRAELLRFGCAVAGPDGSRAWVEFDDIDLDEEPFPAIGVAFERDRPEVLRRGLVGSAACLLFPLADAVAYAADWLVRDRMTGAGRDEALA